MAFVGLAKPTVAKLTESSGSATYSEGFTCGKAIEVTISPQYAEGSLYGDNGKAEYDKEFKYADITLNTTTLPIQAHSTMFGHTVADNPNEGITDKTTDESNYVGFGIYVSEKVDGVKKYVAMWIHKSKFTEGEEGYKTKGDSIEYQTPSITGQAMGNAKNEWRERKIFDTEEDAQKWLDEKAGMTEPPAPAQQGAEEA